MGAREKLQASTLIDRLYINVKILIFQFIMIFYLHLNTKKMIDKLWEDRTDE